MIVSLAAGCSASSADGPKAPAPDGDVSPQTATDDPCRYLTAAEMGKAFGRSMKSSKHANVCQYQGTGNELVVVKVEAGAVGTIMRYAKLASAPGQKNPPEKVSTPAGEAYFDASFPVFIGHVGNHDVQIETTIEPLPRDAMIAVGKRVMEMLPAR